MNFNISILSFDTSLTSCSVSILNNGKIYSLFKICPKKHEKYILKMIKKILNIANINFKKINFIACTIGPGSFTGIRITINIAQTLSVMYNIPLLSFSTFQILSEQNWNKFHINRALIAIKIYKNSFFWGKYYRNKFGIWVGIHTEKYYNNIYILPKLLQNLKGKWAAIGTAWKRNIVYKKSIKLIHTNITIPHAKDIIFCAKVYLKKHKVHKIMKIYPNYIL